MLWLAWDWRPVLVCLLCGEGDDTYEKVIDFDVTQDDAEAKLKRYVGLHGPQNKHKNSEEHYANLKKAYEDPAIRERLREEQDEMHPYSERRRSQGRRGLFQYRSIFWYRGTSDHFSHSLPATLSEAVPDVAHLGRKPRIRRRLLLEVFDVW